MDNRKRTLNDLIRGVDLVKRHISREVTRVHPNFAICINTWAIGPPYGSDFERP